MHSTRTEIGRETARRLRRLDLDTGQHIRRMRLDANVSVAALSRATGIDAAYLGRIEAGQARPSTEILIAIGVAIGADLSLRYFPGNGPRIHDRIQAPMIEALLGSLHPRWWSDLEVPVTQPARGVIDAVLRDARSGIVIATEVQSDLRRLEQQIRRGREKAEGLAARLRMPPGRGGPVVSQLLVLRSTARTRELARLYAETLRAAFPARSEDACRSLTSDFDWPGAAIIWMHVHGATATVMRFPPRGVELGR